MSTSYLLLRAAGGGVSATIVFLGASFFRGRRPALLQIAGAALLGAVIKAAVDLSYFGW